MFANRRAAGHALAERLRHLEGAQPVVLALPRGGVPVAFEVARELRAPLDVMVVRKIGAPGNPEFGIGAVAEGGVRVLNEESVRSLLIGVEELEHTAARAAAEVEERVRRYRGSEPPIPLKGRTVIVIDDGVATGGTARAALRAARAQHPAKLVFAVPVGPPATVERLAAEVDEVVCVEQPEVMWAVGMCYEDFSQTSDDEVIGLLDAARGDAGVAAAGPVPSPADPPVDREVTIPLPSGEVLGGHLAVPEDARGLVVFAHGSGSSRHSPRNRAVAAAMNERGLGTLLFDLLTPSEERERTNVFDIPLLAHRLELATRWLDEDLELSRLPLGYFGASTGAGAALVAAAGAGRRVGAVVSRGGRPDLAVPRLGDVSAPVLLIVGGRDELVLELNREALRQLPGEAELAIVPGATHLFEEPGALGEVADLASDWFLRHLAPAG